MNDYDLTTLIIFISSLFQYFISNILLNENNHFIDLLNYNNIIDINKDMIINLFLYYNNFINIILIPLYFISIQIFLISSFEHIWIINTIKVFFITSIYISLSTYQISNKLFSDDITNNITIALSPCFSILSSYTLYLLYCFLIRGPVPEHKTNENEKLFNLKNKIVILTGSSAGIGIKTAIRLAKLNCTLILPNRSLERGNKAKELIIKQTGNKNIHVMKLDMASFDSVKSFAKEFLNKFNKLDLFISNAGVLLPNRILTVDKKEMVMQVNHYSVYLLTLLLIPALKNGSMPKSKCIFNNKSNLIHNSYGNNNNNQGNARIVLVGSSFCKVACRAHNGFKSTDLDSEDSYAMFTCYGRSKLAR